MTKPPKKFLGYHAYSSDEVCHWADAARIIEGLDQRIAELESQSECHEHNHEAALALLEEARKRIAELEAERRWIPVEERLPPMDGDDSSETCSVDVLLHAEFRMTQPWRRVGYWDRINGWHWDDDSPVHPDVRITHWQAITPPEATDAG